MVKVNFQQNTNHEGPKMKYSKNQKPQVNKSSSSANLKPKEMTRVYEIESIPTLKAKLMRTLANYDQLYASYLELKGQSKLNQMTGLFNISHFGEVIMAIQKNGIYGTLLIFDICDFKIINRELGFEVGNKVLSLIGERMRLLADHETVVGYFGGNRIAVYKKKKLVHSDARNLFSQIRDDVCEIMLDYYPLNIRGVVIPMSKTISNVNEAYIKSEVLLNRIKELNRDFLFYDSNYQQIEASKEELANYVKHSVKNRSFFVVYQEKVDSRTNKVIGLEALARLKKDDRVISPDIFISILEESDLIVQFGKELIRTVFADMKTIAMKYGIEAIVSINISPKQLKYNDIESMLVKLSAEYEVDLNRIELEITENVFVNDIDSCMSQLTSLQKKGVKFAIDDFGTGYSSLKYLTKLPVNTLKIDKSFIDQLYHSKSRSVVKAIIDVAKASNLNIVAEGVEEKKQVEILSSIGCNVIQGFYYSKPKLLDIK